MQAKGNALFQNRNRLEMRRGDYTLIEIAGDFAASLETYRRRSCFEEARRAGGVGTYFTSEFTALVREDHLSESLGYAAERSQKHQHYFCAET